MLRIIIAVTGLVFVFAPASIATPFVLVVLGTLLLLSALEGI